LLTSRPVPFLLSKGLPLARRKTGDLHCRADPDNKALWQACADELGVSLSMWIEVTLNRAVLDRRRERALQQMYPNRPDLREPRRAAGSLRVGGRVR
jgi:hypothetical protein